MIMGVSPAVALTVAVFFMGITRGEWVELWAGVLGAIPASVISAAVAAGVAVTVLNRSNAHQQVLAAEAAAGQQRLTEVQLEQQKRLSDLQLAEQRREAATSRERISIADVIASAGALVYAGKLSREAIELEQSLFSGAVTRWRLELGPGAMSDELNWWDTLMLAAAMNHFWESNKECEGSSQKSFEILNHLVATISAIALHWQAVDEDTRVALIDRARAARLGSVDVLEEMTGHKVPG